MAKSGDHVAAASERAERARGIVAARAYLATAGAVLVYSDRPGVVGYTIENGGSCPCPDRQLGEARRLGIPCYHEMAVQMVRGATRALAPRTLAPRESDDWLDTQDERAVARLRLARIEREFA